MKYQIFKLTTAVSLARQRVGFILTEVSGPIDTLPAAEEQLNQLSDPSHPEQYTILPIYIR